MQVDAAFRRRGADLKDEEIFPDGVDAVSSVVQGCVALALVSINP